MSRANARSTSSLGRGNGEYPSVSALKFIRKLPGGSQSILTYCDDGYYYVVKMGGNPQGYNTLANELLGHQLIRTMGLPVTEYAFVKLSHAFVTTMYPHGWFQLSSGTHRPEAGIHLGCRFVGWPDGEPRTSDFIGRRQVAAVTNRADFLGMLILDAWADNQDQRQAVFWSDTRPGPLKAVFIDHGMMFGGPECIFKDDKCRAFYYSLDVYKGLWKDREVDLWTSRLSQLAPGILRRSYNFVPHSWYDQNHKSVRLTLIERINSLERLLEPYAERLSP